MTNNENPWTDVLARVNHEDNTNLCAECSQLGIPDALADVTHCENCGLPIEGRRSLWR